MFYMKSIVLVCLWIIGTLAGNNPCVQPPSVEVDLILYAGKCMFTGFSTGARTIVNLQNNFTTKLLRKKGLK